MSVRLSVCREQAVVTVLDALTFSEQDGFSLPPTLADQKLARRIVDALLVADDDRIERAWEAGFWEGIEAARSALLGVAMPDDWQRRAKDVFDD